VNIGAPELILILVIALIVFGPKRLPEVGRTIGKSLREFRRASQDIRDEFRFSLDDDDPPAPAPSPAAPQASFGDEAAEPRPTPKARSPKATKPERSA
jgi:sec-independent protein translocase protein TatA